MTRFTPSVRTALAISLAASIACSLPGLPAGSEVPAAASPVSSGAASVGTPTQASGEAAPDWVEIEPPPPAGILDAVEAKVDSGEWTYEEGLIQSLRIFTGDGAPENAFAQVPRDMEGTGLAFEAQRYLSSGADEQAKAEIGRLLNIVAPDPVRLLEYSTEEGAFHRVGGLARPVDLSVECAALWYDGFPPGQNLQCYQYKTDQLLGSTIRVFIPQQPDLIWGFQSGYADAAILAVKESLAVFSGFSVQGKASVLDDVDVVFTLLDTPKGDALAIVATELAGTQGCRIMIYPGAVLDNEDKKNDASDFGVFQQTVAHEMFHCYTAWNLPAHQLSALNYGWQILDWWAEGGAEYFSNVVYPDVNDEWGLLGDWAYNSGKERVVGMSYENFGFFQYLANTIGNNGVLNLIASIPPTQDEDSQAAALAASPNMQTLFHDYARAYIDGTIRDGVGATETDGPMLPTTPAYVLPEYRLAIGEPDTFLLAGPPLVLMRYGLTFENDRLYSVNSVTTGSEGFDAARPRELPGAWADLPAEVAASCSPVKYYFLMTSAAAPAADLFSIDLAIDVKSDLACDECLIGVWDLNVASFKEYAEAPFAETPGYYQFIAAGGPFRYGFRADATLTGEFDFTYVYRLNQENSPLGNDVGIDGSIKLEGEGLGHYTSDGIGGMTMMLADSGVKLTQTLAINGEEMDPTLFGGSGPNFGAGSLAVRYSCDGDKLYLNFLPEASALPPILFDRDPSADP